MALERAVGPAETALPAFPRPEGQHVVVLVGVGLPQQPQQRELQLLPPVLPIAVNHLSQLLSRIYLQRFLALPL